jgi:hypothetical protein
MKQDYKYPALFTVEDWGTKQAEDREHACEKCMVRLDATKQTIQPIWRT